VKIVSTQVPNGVWVTAIEADPLADVVTCHRLDPAKSQPLETSANGNYMAPRAGRWRDEGRRNRSKDDL